MRLSVNVKKDCVEWQQIGGEERWFRRCGAVRALVAPSAAREYGYWGQIQKRDPTGRWDSVTDPSGYDHFYTKNLRTAQAQADRVLKQFVEDHLRGMLRRAWTLDGLRRRGR